jgi:hypothetical protein
MVCAFAAWVNASRVAAVKVQRASFFFVTGEFFVQCEMNGLLTGRVSREAPQGTDAAHEVSYTIRRET